MALSRKTFYALVPALLLIGSYQYILVKKADDALHEFAKQNKSVSIERASKDYLFRSIYANVRVLNQTYVTTIHIGFLANKASLTIHKPEFSPPRVAVLSGFPEVTASAESIKVQIGIHPLAIAKDYFNGTRRNEQDYIDYVHIAFNDVLTTGAYDLSFDKLQLHTSSLSNNQRTTVSAHNININGATAERINLHLHGNYYENLFKKPAQYPFGFDLNIVNGTLNKAFASSLVPPKSSEALMAIANPINLNYQVNTIDDENEQISINSETPCLSFNIASKTQHDRNVSHYDTTYAVKIRDADLYMPNIKAILDATQRKSIINFATNFNSLSAKSNITMTTNKKNARRINRANIELDYVDLSSLTLTDTLSFKEVPVLEAITPQTLIVNGKEHTIGPISIPAIIDVDINNPYTYDLVKGLIIHPKASAALKGNNVPLRITLQPTPQ